MRILIHLVFCPNMVNAWIPVAGKFPLGTRIGASSHLLPENKIIRSVAGAEMNGRKFSVNCIKSWDQSNRLVNIYPDEGQLLCFSSFIVHGLGINRNTDTTRVALEFRLHNQSL